MSKNLHAGIAAALVALAITSEAGAAQCGNSAAGFEGWKQQFAGEARANQMAAAMAWARAHREELARKWAELNERG